MQLCTQTQKARKIGLRQHRNRAREREFGNRRKRKREGEKERYSVFRWKKPA